MRKTEEIPLNGLSGQFIDDVRCHFLKIFSLPEKQELARKVFDEYMAAGGDFQIEDLKRLMAIVEDNYVREEKNAFLTECAVEEARFLVRGAALNAGKVWKMRQLPRKGSASADKGKAAAEERSPETRGNEHSDGSMDEFELLLEHQDALKPARLPSELVCRDEITTVKPPKKSGITLTEAIFRRKGEKKKRA